MNCKHKHPSVLQCLTPRNLQLARFVAVDGALQELKRCREQVTPLLGKSCAAFVEERGWKWFGAARLSNHSVERFGRTARWVRELAAIGRGLARLPGFEEAVTGDQVVGDGHKPLGRTTAARLARVATPASFDAWLAVARQTSHRGFIDAVKRATAAGSEFPLGSGGRAGDSTESTRVDSGDPAGRRGNAAATNDGQDPAIHDSLTGGTDKFFDDDDEASSDFDVRLCVPGSLRAGFEYVLELHRAVCGCQVPVWDFIEALVAEALSGAVPAQIDPDGVPEPDFNLEWLRLRRGPSRADVERRLAARAGNWGWMNDSESRAEAKTRGRRLKADRDLDELLGRLLLEARDHCKRLDKVAGRAGCGRPAELHDQIVELLQLDDAIERSIGHLLGWISRHRACGKNLFNGVGHYAEERLGMHRREAQMRAAVDRALQHFPILGEAYLAGDLGLEAFSILLRILGPRSVDPEIEAAWLRRATKSSIKRLRDEARAALHNWLEDLGSAAPMPMTDQAWSDSLALFPGTTQRRLKRLVEDERPSRRGRPEIVLFLRLPEELANRFIGAVEDRRRRCIDGLDVAPSATRLAKMFSAKNRQPPPWIGLLAMLEEYTRTWDDPKTMPRRRFLEIYARQGWRCAAPGCTSRCNLESHHLIYLSRGGSNDASNLVAVCRFHHHLGEHGWLASCLGRAPLNVRWRLGHVDVGGWFVNEVAVCDPAVQFHRRVA